MPESPAQTDAAPDLVTLSIDGVEVEVEPGTLVIEAALEAGVYIPHFCWHPRMTPVAKCRMCLVEIEGVRGLPPACTTPVADEMVVTTTSETVCKAQEGVLEFLLINHPLDCPVCDRGGECPLQDQTMAFGPGESRFVEQKRHYEKPIPISDLVLLDRERCVLCDRCTRFADEIAGDPLISFVERGNQTQVLTFPDQPFKSYFSGNTVEICPVGALTAAPYRFRARPWDLEEVETTCTQCAVGCRGKVQSSSSRVVRLLGVDSEPVNQGWLCDKGRFAFEHLHVTERLTAPLIRSGDGFVEASWGEALDAIAEGVAANRGKESAVLGGARSTVESSYLLAKLAREVLETERVDARLGDASEATFLSGKLVAGPGGEEVERGVISDVDSASAIVLAGPDLKEELPVLYLRVRQAVTKKSVPLIEVSADATGLTKYASHSIRHRPGEAGLVLSALVDPDGANDPVVAAAARDLAEASERGKVLVAAGRANLAETESAKDSAAVYLASKLGGKVLPLIHRANTVGALAAGCSPLSPEFDATRTLRAAARGDIGTLICVGADPIRDHPDRSVALEAIGRVGFLVAVDIFLTDTALAADVVLPASGWAEQVGTFVNLEGRAFRLEQKVTPPGLARPEWFALAEIAKRLAPSVATEGVFEIASSGADAILDHMGSELPVFAGVDSKKLLAASMGGQGILLDLGAGDEFVGAPDTSDPPRIDQYDHRVIASRALYGDGEVNRHCPSLGLLSGEARAVLAKRDAERLGVDDKDLVRLKNDRGDLDLPVVIDDAVPEGSVGVWLNRSTPEGGRIADLIDATADITEVRIETVRGDS